VEKNQYLSHQGGSKQTSRKLIQNQSNQCFRSDSKMLEIFEGSEIKILADWQEVANARLVKLARTLRKVHFILGQNRFLLYFQEVCILMNVDCHLGSEYLFFLFFSKHFLPALCRWHILHRWIWDVYQPCSVHCSTRNCGPPPADPLLLRILEENAEGCT
jgi:hypothetical protein